MAGPREGGMTPSSRYGEGQAVRLRLCSYLLTLFDQPTEHRAKIRSSPILPVTRARLG